MTTSLQSGQAHLRGIHCAQKVQVGGEEVCKLFPLKLAGSQQESFAQEEDMIHPRGIQLASPGIQDQSSSRKKALNSCGRCRGS